MLDEYGNLIDMPETPMSRHELGQQADIYAGRAPMGLAPPVVRVPPPFPLAAYLVMKQ